MTATGRYAPSPTGALHLGNLRTAVAAWAHARAMGARFLVRVEDIDAPRVVPGAEARQLEDLAALGLDWDEPPLRQSTRHAAHEAAFRALVGRGLAYPCFCSRTEVREALSAPHATDPLARYPGTCARLPEDEARRRIAAGEQHCWRLRVDGAPEEFAEGFAPPLPAGFLRREGDFVIRRGDGPFAYQLACAVDDAETGVTHVLRGGDLLESGARQDWLIRCLGLEPPLYFHIPLLRAEDGRRLSKRDGDDDLQGLCAAHGIDAQGVLSYLAWSLGAAGRAERVTPRELAARFDLGRLPREDWVLRGDDLAAFRQQGA